MTAFSGANQGLWLAEIELSSEEEEFERPIWITEEVTLDHRYSNSYLSQTPTQNGRKMNIFQHQHPLLYARAFVSEWPAPLGKNEIEHIRSYFGIQNFDFQPPNIKTIMRSIRVGGFHLLVETNLPVNI